MTMLGGSIAGVLDILFAVSFGAFNGVSPIRVLQSVASGALGAAAFTGGVPTAVLGLLMHMALSLVWASVFLVVASRWPVMMRRPVLAGVVFGVVVFVVMRLLVLPLSAFPYPVSFKPLATVLDLLSHTLLFGVPIAWAVRKASVGAPAVVTDVGSAPSTGRS